MCLGAVGLVEEIWSEGGIPMASVGGEAVCLMYTPEVSVGDSLLVHLGFAVEVLGEERAASAKTLRSGSNKTEFTKETS